MENCQGEVLECVTNILKEKNMDSKVSLDMELIRDNGISSLEFVSLILDIENKLEIELDCILPNLRKCNTVSEIVATINSMGDF